MSDLFETQKARELFLAQLEAIARGRDRALHVCDRLTQSDERHLRQQVRVLRQLLVELSEDWSILVDLTNESRP